MNPTPQFFAWIDSHAKEDPQTLRLRFAGKPSPEGVDIPAAILQIECRRKCARKLAGTLAAAPEFVFPTALSAEQCSSDRLALFHASLLPEGTRTVVDLTAGLGIDAMTIARKGIAVTAIERQPALADALRHNSRALGIEDFTVECADCRQWLEDAAGRGLRFDAAFIDPARRGSDGERLFALEACEPDVLDMLPLLAQICRRLIIKASPMLDISHTIAELTPPGPARVIAAGTSTECKELIAVVDFPAADTEPTIEAATLLDSVTATFAFTPETERLAPAVPDGPGIAPGMYICEPYPATMKCGAHKVLAERFALFGFGANTRLFYSEESPADDFPGEAFKVIDVQDYASRNIKRFAGKYPAISVTARNFGINADQIRKKLGVREGDGHLRLFAVTAASDKRLLIVCERVSRFANLG